MNLLVVVPWYEPSWSAGGTATAVSSLNRELVKLGINVTVYTTDDAGGGKFLDVDYNQKYEYGGVNVFYFKSNFFIQSKKSFYASELIKKVKNNILKFDLIHIHGTRNAFSLFTSYYARKYRIKYIITPHASLMQWWMDSIGNVFLKKIYMKFFESKVIGNASAIHFLSMEEKAQSNNYTYGAKYFIVENGIQTKRFNRNIKIRDSNRKKYNIKNKKVLLFLGRIHPQKNLHLVVNSLKFLKNTVFFIVGPVGDKKYYQKIKSSIKKNNLQKKVFFIPPVSNKEVKIWYYTADIFVSPSIVEGISMSIIESLSSSLPVIVSKNVANFREIDEDNCGFIVNTNLNDIKNLLFKIENDKIDLNSFSKNAKLSAIKRYEISKVAKKMKKNYLKIINE